MTEHAKENSVSLSTMSRAVSDIGQKSLDKMGKPFLTSAIMAKRRVKSAALINYLKSVLEAGAVHIFKDEQSFCC